MDISELSKSHRRFARTPKLFKVNTQVWNDFLFLFCYIIVHDIV